MVAMAADESSYNIGTAQLVMLVGIPGSGKSTFSKNLIQASGSKIRWHRISQDELGNRRTCEAAARKSLSSNCHTIIDRCNFDTQQRRTWFNIAREYKAFVTVCVLLPPFKVCLQRALERRNHEGKVDALAMGVKKVTTIVKSMQKKLVLPLSTEEGIDRLVYCRNNEDVSSFVQKLAKEVQTQQREELQTNNLPITSGEIQTHLKEEPQIRTSAITSSDDDSTSRITYPKSTQKLKMNTSAITGSDHDSTLNSTDAGIKQNILVQNSPITSDDCDSKWKSTEQTQQKEELQIQTSAIMSNDYVSTWNCTDPGIEQKVRMQTSAITSSDQDSTLWSTNPRNKIRMKVSEIDHDTTLNSTEPRIDQKLQMNASAISAGDHDSTLNSTDPRIEQKLFVQTSTTTSNDIVNGTDSFKSESVSAPLIERRANDCCVCT